MIHPRVCLISHVYLEKRYRAKLRYLAEGVDLRVVSPDEFLFAYGVHRAEFSEERGYQVQVYRCRFPLGVRTSTRWVLASHDLGFRRFQPDIIHVENEGHSFSLLQALVYRRLFAPKAKVVVFVWANHRLTGAKGVVLNLLARWMRPGIDFYIAGNSAAKTLLMQEGIPADRVAVFPLVGVDMDYFHPASRKERDRLRIEVGIGPDEFVIGYVGRFVRDKGIQDLLAAFRVFQGRAKGSTVRLLCVGDGPLKENLLALTPDVLVASPGSNSKVLPYYWVMDVLILPSRTMPYWKEQFGLVLAEAMACGVPVIGSNSGAIPEVLGDAGLVVPEGDVIELASNIWSLYGSPEQRAKLAGSGTKRIAERYSHKRIAERTHEVYQHLLSSSRTFKRKSAVPGEDPETVRQR